LLDNVLQQCKFSNPSKSNQRGRITHDHLGDLSVWPL
jgi:hypothetical protein